LHHFLQGGERNHIRIPFFIHGSGELANSGGKFEVGTRNEDVLLLYSSIRVRGLYFITEMADEENLA
jgi:hypothetical protein